jgi:pantoate--beta-alanine ligase
MIIIETGALLKTHLESFHLSPKGFVPTMGALHAGHLDLVSKAVNDCPLVTVSIFVNPTQFNDPKDLERYPRNLDADISLLSTVMRNDDALFVPSVAEIYPENDTRVFNFGTIDKAMEGAHRPGHFNGVAQVVSRLFDLVMPDIAYFGKKDFQQLAVIAELVRQTGNKVKIVGCPTVREADGLAMSSRNALLTPEHRKNAGIVFRSMATAARLIKTEGIERARDFFREEVEAVAGFRLQYFEVVDDIELIPVNNYDEFISGRNYYICVALYAGDIRLIDNIQISLE